MMIFPDENLMQTSEKWWLTLKSKYTIKTSSKT